MMQSLFCSDIFVVVIAFMMAAYIFAGTHYASVVVVCPA